MWISLSNGSLQQIRQLLQPLSTKPQMPMKIVLLTSEFFPPVAGSAVIIPAAIPVVAIAAINVTPVVQIMLEGNFCSICVKNFANQGSFKVHFGNAHTNKPRILCNACGESNKTQETFDRHNYSCSRRQEPRAGQEIGLPILLIRNIM